MINVVVVGGIYLVWYFFGFDNSYISLVVNLVGVINILYCFGE